MPSASAVPRGGRDPARLQDGRQRVPVELAQLFRDHRPESLRLPVVAGSSRCIVLPRCGPLDKEGLALGVADVGTKQVKRRVPAIGRVREQERGGRAGFLRQLRLLVRGELVHRSRRQGAGRAPPDLANSSGEMRMATRTVRRLPSGCAARGKGGDAPARAIHRSAGLFGFEGAESLASPADALEAADDDTLRTVPEARSGAPGPAASGSST